MPLGGGTDAHRVMWSSPFVSLQWMLDGTTVERRGDARAGRDRPRACEALAALHAREAPGSLHEEGRRGALAVGKLADLVVLSEDYFTVPAHRIGQIVSVLTMIGGHVVYAGDATSK